MTELGTSLAPSGRPRTEKRVVCGMVLLLEAALLAYAVFMSFLFTVFMESDNFAFHATEFDWWVAGGKKFAIVCIATAILVSGMFIANRPLFRWIGLKNPRLPLYLSLGSATVILGAGLIGIAMFIYSKPYI